MSKGSGVTQAVPGNCVESVTGACEKCTGSVWEVCEECLGNAQEVSGKAFLEVVGSAELSANTCKTAR